MEEKQEVKYRIGIIMGLVLTLIGLSFDFIEIILDLASFGFAGTIKDVAQIIFFPTVFLILKAPFWKGKKAGKKLITMITSALVGFVPIISTILPEVAISVLMTVYLTRKEDRENADEIVPNENSDSKITRYRRIREKVR